MVMETWPVFLISVGCTLLISSWLKTEDWDWDASTCTKRGFWRTWLYLTVTWHSRTALCVCSERMLPEDFVSHGCTQQGNSVASGVTVGHYQLSAIFKRLYRCNPDLVKSAELKRLSKLLDLLFFFFFSFLFFSTMLKMAKSFDSHLSPPPVVTKAHWRKPSHVSSFSTEVKHANLFIAACLNSCL